VHHFTFQTDAKPMQNQNIALLKNDEWGLCISASVWYASRRLTTSDATDADLSHSFGKPMQKGC